MSIENQIIIRFAPERWGQVDKFLNFFLIQRPLPNHDRQALEGVKNHFLKATRLLSVANKIASSISEDEKELEEKGYTNRINSLEFAAVVESAVTAFFSSVDCTRQVLNIIYPKAQGLPQSTRKLFHNAKADKIDENVPSPIRESLKNAEWFLPLRVLRDALTHTNTGSCHRDKETGKIRYFNEAVKPISGKGYVDNFNDYLDNICEEINRFQGAIFSELSNILEDTESWQICGFFHGRIYHRFVRPREAVDFNSGRCGAFEWFENKENPACPFLESCGAYKKRV